MSNDYLSLLSIYYELTGIIFAYSLFVLQLWLQNCSEYCTGADSLIFQTAEGDLERYKFRSRGDVVVGGFPISQACIIHFVMIALTSLILITGNKIDSVGFAYDSLPALGLFLLIFGFTVYSRISGARRVREFQRRLS